MTIAPVKRLIEKAGGKRVSRGAAVELAKYLEKRAKDVASEAAELAKHSGRSTVMNRDVRMALKSRVR